MDELANAIADRRGTGAHGLVALMTDDVVGQLLWAAVAALAFLVERLAQWAISP